jgi:hypothetical protein
MTKDEYYLTQGVAIWEAAGATATAASLLWEYIKSVKPQQDRKRH